MLKIVKFIFSTIVFIHVLYSSQLFLFKSSFLLNYDLFYFFLCVCVSSMWSPMEVRRGTWIPWSWSYLTLEPFLVPQPSLLKKFKTITAEHLLPPAPKNWDYRHPLTTWALVLCSMLYRACPHLSFPVAIVLHEYSHLTLVLSFYGLILGCLGILIWIILET